MQWINQLKEKIGLWMLKSGHKHPLKPKKPASLNDAEHIAILYDATFIEKESAIHHFVSRLKQEGKKVYIIGYVNMPKLPGNKKFSLQSDFVWHEKINTFKLPNQAAFQTFLNTPFDILINLYEQPLLPLMALSAWSAASYKIGPYMPDIINFVDVAIDAGKEVRIEQLIEQTNHYLRTIK